MRRRPLLAALPALVTAVAVGAATAGVPSVQRGGEGFAPVKCAPGDVTADGRVFPEPQLSATYLRISDFECGIKLLAQQHPSKVEITTTGTSKGGRPVYDVLLTDETVTGPKDKLLVISSIHGNEIGAREGGARVIEDMLDPRFRADEDFVKKVLKQYVIHFLFPNPDGWAAGDVTGEGSGTAWTRANGPGGRDLNRVFPVQGYVNAANGTLVDPEGRGVRDLLLKEDGGDWYLGTDNHGQLADTYGAAGLQIVGQFDYQKSETLARFADGISGSMAQYPVLRELDTARGASGQDAGPYHWGTLYDMLGYSASGSLIDYYNTVNETNGFGFATELTMSNLQANNAAMHPGMVNQVWTDMIRAINFEMFRQAVDKKQYTYEVGSRAAYLFDPAVQRHDDANGEGYVRKANETAPQQPYDATRMQFFSDLNKYASRDLDAVRVPQVLAGTVDLADYESLVIADNPMPEGTDKEAWVAALQRFVEGGGNLVVTDAAAPLLADLGLVAASDVVRTPRYVGFVDFGDRSLPLNADLRGVASQTYDTVPIGYAFGGTNTAPNWTVTSTAWQAGGGVTAGTNGTGRTVYGEKPLGKGKVRFLGALLPQPTEAYYHPYGLQDYAVTYTGYTLLQNMLKR